MRTPSFWNGKTIASSALLPLSVLYGIGTALRQKVTTPQRVAVPIICIGNVVTGGSGKTPVALALGEILKAAGGHSHYLSRGYGGHLQGPVRVDPNVHTAAEVGDEPLLLARTLPTWVAKERAAGARAAIADGADRIIMDDGFQNPSLHKDIQLLVIDGSYGFGNGRVLPAGPLRESPAKAFSRASGVILIGEDRNNIRAQVPAHIPIIKASIEPVPQAGQLAGQKVVAFAGIARPEKFFATLHALGCDIQNTMSYPDHHRFQTQELHDLKQMAERLNAKLVTTEKDFVRLPESFRPSVTTATVRVIFDDPNWFQRFLVA